MSQMKRGNTDEFKVFAIHYQIFNVACSLKFLKWNFVMYCKQNTEFSQLFNRHCANCLTIFGKYKILGIS